ncbi:hypothetical protein GGP41_003230 [Bipolaris sorokiniana]|uniref:Uncharacterized protein n=1 Tax=Cochliobolus sativus TaxID=45130 RepID=A0A8H6DSN8_COCSA|nr:hypothetical protein GGP41_003230 [Bipolaris sorokiniana]
MVSPPLQPTTLQAAPRLREAASYLVFDCGLRPNGLGPAQLDLIFLDDHKSQGFIHGYAIIKQLSPAGSWALIAEINDERTSMSYLSRYYSITTNHDPDNKRAQLASSAIVSPPAASDAGAHPSNHTADRRIL